MIKRLSLITLALASACGLVACNERDVAVGAGAVGGAIVAGAIYDNYYHRDYRHSRGYYTGGVGYWDRYDGRYYRCGYNRWCRDARYTPRPWPYHNGWRFSAEPATVQLATLENAAAMPSPSSALSGKYQISLAAAKAVGAAFSEVESSGKLDRFHALGVSDADVARLQRGEEAGLDSVLGLMKTLGAKEGSVKALLLDVRDEYSLYAQGGVN